MLYQQAHIMTEDKKQVLKFAILNLFMYTGLPNFMKISNAKILFNKIRKLF